MIYNIYIKLRYKIQHRVFQVLVLDFCNILQIMSKRCAYI